MEEYRVRDGRSISGNVQAIGECLQGIKEKHGSVDPHIVVSDAKSKNSPMHNCFEWNNAKAGQKFRIWQARHLTRSIVVKSYIEGGHIFTAAFINLEIETKKGKENRYIDAKTVFENHDLMRLHEEKLLRRLESIQKELSDLARLSKYADLFTEIEKIIPIDKSQGEGEAIQ